MRHAIGDVLTTLVVIYILLLFARMVLSWVVVGFGLRPRGALAALAEIAWSSTDPVVRPLDRWLPSYRFGNVVVPTGFLVAIITAFVLLGVVEGL